MKLEKRIAIEKRIAKKVVQDLLAQGYKITVYDGESCPISRSCNQKDILDAMFSVDEEYLFAYAQDEKKRTGSILFIYGNDGWDVIADYSISLEEALAGANALADKICEEEA